MSRSSALPFGAQHRHPKASEAASSPFKAAAREVRTPSSRAPTAHQSSPARRSAQDARASCTDSASIRWRSGSEDRINAVCKHRPQFGRRGLSGLRPVEMRALGNEDAQTRPSREIAEHAAGRPRSCDGKIVPGRHSGLSRRAAQARPPRSRRRPRSPGSPRSTIVWPWPDSRRRTRSLFRLEPRPAVCPSRR